MIRAMNKQELMRAKDREAANKSKEILLKDAIETKKAILNMYRRDLDQLIENSQGVRSSYISADIAILSERIARHANELAIMEERHER